MPPYELDEASLAAERTLLAWNRTGFALLATGGAILRLFPSLEAAAGRPVVGFALVGLGGLCFLFGYLGYGRSLGSVADGGSGPTPTSQARLRVLAAGVSLVAVVALVVAFLPRRSGA